MTVMNGFRLTHPETWGGLAPSSYDDELARMQHTAEWGVELQVGDSTRPHLTVSAPGQAPDTQGERTGMFPGGLSMEFGQLGELPSADDVAIATLTAMAIAGMHEAMEWVFVDGHRLACPHPDHEDEMWEWLRSEIEPVVRRYLDRYPYTDLDVIR